MEQYKQEFIEFMVESNVLKFGDFTLKSGRKSPFFMNAGAYVTGAQLRKLGQYYAKAIHEHYGDDFDVLFGPAYKGIPLSVATTMAFDELYGKEIAIVLTVRKSRIMEIPAFFWEARSRMEIKLSSLRMLRHPASPLRRHSRSFRLRGMWRSLD